jgi:murein L,D-transpeptidase YcbB/YkuD
MPRIFILIALFAASIEIISCNGHTSEQQKTPRSDTIPTLKQVVTDPSIPGNFSPQTKLHFDSAQIDIFLKKYPDFVPFKKEIVKFYRGRSYAYAWFEDAGLIEPSMDLYYRIINILDEGIPMGVPYLKEYKTMIEGDEFIDPQSTFNPEMELMITAQYFHYAKEAWSGLSENQSRSAEWYIPRKKLAYDKLLDSMLVTKNEGREIKEPVYHQYTLLKKYLKRFREIEKNGTWMTIKSDRKKYVKGDTSHTIADIRKKLFLAGDLKNDDGSDIFDENLESGVKSYQRRYGLTEDGVVGPALIREMNAPLSKRIQQIVVNMERARWIGADPIGEHLVVNIPQYQLLVYDGDSLSWSCKVVVGKEANKTAIFQGTLKYIVFSPYWNVPASILNKEILPAIRRNPNYLAAHHMEWSGKGVRQKPGESNALGRVKFLFPNSFSMYLHDTPSKSLFSQDRRAFSHGCIRVAEPRKLAIHLLRGDSSWTPEKIDAAMYNEKEVYVTLKKTMPVSIVYFTSWVDGQGRINFRDDVYKRDARVMDMIFTKK